MSIVALSELLGAIVRDATGAVRGRVREIAVAPQDHPTRIAFLIVKTPDGERVLAPGAITSAGASVRAGTDVSEWLINDRELMGPHVNSRAFNAIAWVTVTVMIALTLAMFVTQL